jgi:VWFA-related protein
MELRKSFWLPISFLFFLLMVTTGMASSASEEETRTLDCQPGDTLVVQNDFGRVRATSWDGSSMAAEIRRIALDSSQLENVVVALQRSGKKIFLQAFFYDYASESAYLDLKVPAFVNLVVWGANPAVELYDLKGSVRVHTLTGFITAHNLQSSASMVTEDGNILYRTSIQPSGDIRLESLRGNITCEVIEGLNLRGWLRSGGTLSWNNEIEMNQGSLERQIGIGGPLFFACSDYGNVSVKLQTDLALHTPQILTEVPSGQTSSSRGTTENRSRPVEMTGGRRSPTEAPVVSSRNSSSSTGDPGSNPSPVPATIQSSPSTAASQTGGYSLKVNVDWVYVNASVRDRYTNRAVPDLLKEDFEIFEDGVRQKIEKFDSTEAPFNLLLLLDVSGSTKSYIQLIKEASIEFANGINPQDRLAIATFNSRTRLRQDFTNDRAQVEKAIRGIKSGGGTAFYDALDRCVTRYMDDLEGRKAIVVFTDGVDNQLTGDWDNGSQITFPDLYREIQEAETLIYTIFLDTEDEHGRTSGPMRRGGTGLGGVLGDIIFGRPVPGPTGGGGGWGGLDPAYAEARRELELIADQTGGRMYAPRRIDDLTFIYQEIADDLRVQYTLGYTSQNPARDGSWRELNVKVKNRSDVAVRARKGYYGGKDG